MGMLLWLCLFVGLLLMHGVQSSASPTDTHGIPLVSSTTMQMPVQFSGHTAGPACPCDGHQHPGGQMCLALLVLGALLLFSALFIRSVPGRITPRPSAADAAETLLRNQHRHYIM